jgi:hypothetical protein
LFDYKNQLKLDVGFVPFIQITQQPNLAMEDPQQSPEALKPGLRFSLEAFASKLNPMASMLDPCF